jgi:hypothetical protein
MPKGVNRIQIYDTIVNERINMGTRGAIGFRVDGQDKIVYTFVNKTFKQWNELKGCKTCNGTGVEGSGACHCGDAMEGHSAWSGHSPDEIVRPCPDCIRVWNMTGKTIHRIEWIAAVYIDELDKCLVVFDDGTVAFLTVKTAAFGATVTWDWDTYPAFKERIMELARTKHDGPPVGPR